MDGRIAGILAGVMVAGSAASVFLLRRLMKSRWGEEQDRRARERWQSTAAAMGLGMAKKVAGTIPDMSGLVDGFRISVTSRPSGLVVMTSLSVEARGSIPREVTVFERSQADWIPAGPDLVTGDKDFDAAFGVRGWAPDAMALLNRRHREQIRRELPALGRHGRACIHGGGILLDVPQADLTPEGLVATIRDAVRVAKGLQGRRSVFEKLVRSAASEPLASVRARCLLALRLHRGPGISEPRRFRVLHDAMRDVDPEVRLAAASGYDTEAAHRTLRSLAVDRSVPGHVRIRAVQSWPTLATDVASELTELSRSGDGRAMLELAAAVKSNDLAELILMGVLERDERDAAVRRLAEIGTAASVPGLMALGRRSGLDVPLRRSVRAALESIQSRLGLDAAGRVALAELDAQEGALSPASDGGPGALSQAQRESG